MTRNEILTVLRKIQAYDGRTIGEGDVLAWHEAIGDLDCERAKAAVPKFFSNAENASKRCMPGHIRGICDDIRRGLVEYEHTARVTGRDVGELQRKADADARRGRIAACGFCDDEGWISGVQLGTDGVSRETAMRCDHTDRRLPVGFTPDGVRA